MAAAMTSSVSGSPPPAAQEQHAPISPPPPPFGDQDLPVIPSDDWGMIADDEGPADNVPAEGDGAAAITSVKGRKGTRTRRQITYVSRHFVKSEEKKQTRKECETPVKKERGLGNQTKEKTLLATPPVTPARSRPRIYYGVNIDEFSSDSSLTDVPDDIGPDPFSLHSPSRVQAVKVKTPRRPTKSPYFPHPHKHRPTFLSTLPFPPLFDERFGLMQERLAHDPFRLLIATIFLNKTPGQRAMPVFYQLMARYPTASDLANADTNDIVSIIYGLGFQNQRARKCVAMAKVWVENPPERGKRYKKLNYPVKGDGKDVDSDAVLDDDDTRVAWEISHLPGLGPYSHDSWRMFCRDELRGVAESWNGEGARTENFEPEWKRVLPLDKELRAYLTWMWLKDGFVWNKETGKRAKASDELMATARGGGVVIEDRTSEHLIVRKLDEEQVTELQDERKVERTAGEYMLEDAGIEDGNTGQAS